MTFIVEGRHFTKQLYAITYAQQRACETGRVVEVNAEATDLRGRHSRTWLCRMHPPGVKRTLLKQPPIPQVAAVAV